MQATQQQTNLPSPFPNGLTVDVGKRQTSWASKSHPPKIIRRYEGSSRPSRSLHVIEEGEKAGGVFSPLGNSMWNTTTFNDAK